MDIDLSEPMPSRPARICLSFHLGCVFADFDVDGEGRLYLLCISFDGHGCCQAPVDIGRMRREDSLRLLSMAESRAFDAKAAEPILRRYFAENEAGLWGDALREYDLV